MKVLVADDDLDQLSLRCALLNHNGLQAFQASDSESALAIAETEAPECAVIDLRLPDEESGLRLVRTLRALHPGLRIILLTGYTAARLPRRPEMKLVDDVVQKSAGSAALIRRLKAFETATSR